MKIISTTKTRKKISDLTGQKIRPALILSKQNQNADVIVLFITPRSKK